MAEVQVPMYETSPWPNADQPGDPGSVDTNDDRFLSAVWQNGELWVATVPSRCHHVPASAEVAAENPGRRGQAVAGMTRAERDEPFEMDFASGWNTKFGRHAMTDNGPGPWRDWLTGGELPSRDFYVGLVAYEGGAMIEYALFGDPDWDHDTTKEVLDDWNDFVEDDLDAVGCTCEHVRVAVFRTDTRTPEERMSPEGALIPKKRSSTFYYWHSDQDCPGNERLNL